MATTSFDLNAWYVITPLTQTYSALVSGWGDTNGSAFLSTTNNSADYMQWQLYPLHQPADTYLIRCRTRFYGFLGTTFNSDRSDWLSSCVEDGINCSTTLWMRTGADASSVWTLNSWGNGAYDAYYLTNVANGSYRADEQPNDSWLYMSDNMTDGRPGQQWTFTSVAAINDVTFSTIDPSLLLFTNTAIATSASTTSTNTAAPTTTAAIESIISGTAIGTNPPSTPFVTFTPTATPTSSPKPSSGLSTGAKAGIGVGASLIGLLFIGALIWYCLPKRRNNRSQNSSNRETFENREPALLGNFSDDVKERPYSDAPHGPVELDSRAIPHELEAAPATPRNVHELSNN